MDRKTINMSILIASALFLLAMTSCNTDKAPSQPSCVGAGSVSPMAGDCCFGLTRNFVAEYDSTSSCEELSENSVRAGTVYYICTACGNKNCESWENRCNCPQDCKFP